MRSSICVIAAFAALSAVLPAQVVYPSDTAEAFRRHTLARLGGSGVEVTTALKTGSNGEVYIAGNTRSTDFPVTNAAQPESAEAQNMRSTDGGHTWTRFTLPPIPVEVALSPALLFRAHPSIPGVVFVASGSTLWRSTDSGESWQSVFVARRPSESEGATVSTIGFDDRNPRTVYLSSSEGFSISEDGGTTWQTKPRAPANYVFLGGFGPYSQPRIESDPFSTGALIANSGSVAWLSKDRGATWTPLRPPAGQTSSVAAFSRSRQGRIFGGISAGATGSLWVSDDWGQTWTVTKAQPGSAVTDLLTDPDAPDLLYVVTLGALQVSADGGETWMPPPTGDSLLASPVARATGCPSGALLVTTMGWRVVSSSADRGRTWQAGVLRDVRQFTAGAGCAIYALKDISGDGFVARVERDGAVRWATYLGELGAENITALTLDRAGSVLLAGTTGATADVLVAKYTSDGSLLWTKRFGGSQTDTPLDIAPTADGGVLIAGRTSSEDFPWTPGTLRAEQPSGFALKLTASGDIVWAAQLNLAPQSIALEPDDSALLVGSDRLLRLNPAGTAIEDLPTVLTHPALVRTDTSGNVVIAGTLLPDETPAGPLSYASPLRAQQCGAVMWSGPVWQARTDIVVSRLRARTLDPEFSAILSGECGSRPDSLDVTPDGRLTIGFVTQSQAFDLRAPIATAGFCGYDLSTGVAQLSADGTQLLRSTLLEGCSSVRVAARNGIVFAASDNTGDGLVIQLPISPGSEPRLDGASNAFSGVGFGVAPGQLVSLRGAGLGPPEAIDLGIAPETNLPLELGGTQVLFNGRPAPLLRVSEDQVIFAAPYALEGKSATVQVIRDARPSNELIVPLINALPALLAAGFPHTQPGAVLPAIARNADGTLNSPSNPARLGSTVWVFATGLGATNVPVHSGEVASSEGLRPTGLFRDSAVVPFYFSPYEEPAVSPAIRSMPGFLNSIFAFPVIAREIAATPGTDTITITNAQYTRGTTRRSYSPNVQIYVCTPDDAREACRALDPTSTSRP